MNRRMLSITAALALAIAAAVAPVYAQGNGLTAHVPFAFSVSSSTLRAGDYRFSPLSQHAWEIRNEQGTPAIATVARPDGSNDDEASAKLVFKRCGAHYFLSELVAAGANISIPASKAERELEREMARNGAQSQKVIVLASLR